MMKIAHLIFSLSPGGAEILVKDIVLNSNIDHCLEVWSIGTSGDPEFEKEYENELNKSGITLIKFNKIPHKNRFKIIKELRNAIINSNPDIIHTHSEIVTIYAILASFGLNKILIETIHNTIISYPFIQRFFIKHFVKKYVAISKNTANLISKVIKVRDDNIETIFNGINIKRFQVSERVVKESVSKMIAVGRLDDQKDHFTMLQAYSILKNRIKEYNLPVPILMIVGIGKLRSLLEQFVKKNNLIENVIFMGARSDIPDLLNNSDIWIMSSRWEGLSIALLEALASGIPVVATDVGSNSEVILHGQNGSLIPKQDPEKLANEIFNLITNKSVRIKYSNNSLRTIEEFSILKCTAKYNSLYNSFYSVSKSVSLQQY